MAQIDRGRRNGISFNHMMSDGVVYRVRESNGFKDSSSSSSSSSSVSPPPPLTSSSGVSSIEHRVSKLDTLAGIAIKYGVEVADIKRMNSLVTDRQMFAHKKLQIPLPGRHPPSTIVSNGSSNNRVQTPSFGHHNDLLELFHSIKSKPEQKRVSPAMSSLQGYYGLTPPKKGLPGEGIEMTVCRTSNASTRIGDRPPPPVSPFSEPPPYHHRKTRSLINGFLSENSDLAEDFMVAEGEDNGDADKTYSDKSVRRRQRADIDLNCRTPDLFLRDENEGALSGRIGKHSTPKLKSGRTDLDSTRANTNPIGDLFAANGFFSVRKSSSTSDLQDSNGPSIRPTTKDSNSSGVWPTTRRSLKTDSISRPLFDGLPKPMAIRRKAALD